VKHFFETIDGWFNFREVYDTALREAADGAVFVEVGSWYGRSAAYMAVEIANSGKRIDFYCIDTWQGSVDTPWMAAHLAGKGGSAFPFFRENMERGGAWHLIKPVQQSSEVAASRFPADSIDFVMIDGAHDYHSVRRDVRAWLPKLKPGGLLAGDDAGWPGVLIGVHETIPMSELTIQNGGANWLYRKHRPERGHWSVRNAADRDRDYLVGIPFVNRADLLDRAVRSLANHWPAVVVLDQSASGLREEDHDWMRRIAGVFRAEPGTMSFTQMMNWLIAEARERQVQFLAFMHNDAECLDGVAMRSIELARSQPRAGVVFTNYDAFAVFRVSALQDAGPWDESFRWYFADNDYYRRLRLRGWECLDFGGEQVLHHTSQTLRSDAAIGAEVASQWKWHADHYGHKWGGPTGAEKHAVPYNGLPW
jgi:SAM-dependent methyltransferase